MLRRDFVNFISIKVNTIILFLLYKFSSQLTLNKVLIVRLGPSLKLKPKISAWADRGPRSHVEFHHPGLPRTGQKVCGGGNMGI